MKPGNRLLRITLDQVKGEDMKEVGAGVDTYAFDILLIHGAGTRYG